MINVLFAARPERWTTYEQPLRDALAKAGVEANLAVDLPPEEVDYIVYAPNSDLQDFTPYTRAKAVLNLWAGVENITGNKTLSIPLARMVDPGLTKGMVEWVTGHVMRYHLGIDTDILRSDAQWQPRTPPLAQERSVVILGLGALGAAVAQTLIGLGFEVSGWSRSAKSIEGVTCYSGDAGLTQALSRAEIAVLLLPDTPATENTLNADTLAAMPRGAFIINPGRGPLIDDDALLAALNTGQIAHATLDVFRIEPLPQDHPYWAHPQVTVTPHIAAETRASTASEAIVENIRRGEAGEPYLNLVDRSLGY
ncbi:glyoxylate/hydroxypyruvate reductase A [Sulfitobacter mediterraneus]|uniref:2-hydroxyacid dehydrogenase n=1 Tax=Sulfitobacter mediterraneus TaxID=83219 RepID=UPI001939F859|nr:glyoxylate/hydroxypyruvate reductase A [Sulfitobacter mediterraneus]MBM1557701.1 glyoxylate/hydroxypyruvate reductase A [Sulfitobacter mediterraneus]MBM1569430.1 glyoxylate/hydroxypyruvate reductase A [Sulfitobacter mediterraneus]MBM1572874.1 glyoxylate/hydroxypyruvate reductase A [Sulfitobacter mediterraneus]MBM1577037.1 glyoxylate/hydroxypyruvate reductase A [Sulfitobacter mediterraneus]MBM1580463.1 glyoxylate/hydroxypyruvate reductase A [Sulfitobacter mediterraneus]